MASAVIYRLQIRVSLQISIEEPVRKFKTVLLLKECAEYMAGNGLYACDPEFHAIRKQPVIDTERIAASLKTRDSIRIMRILSGPLCVCQPEAELYQLIVSINKSKQS